MLEIIGQALLAVLLLTGCLLALIAAFALHRFPDLFCRMHGATKPASLGLLLVAVAAALAIAAPAASVKLLLVVVLQFLTVPVSAHMVGRAAYRAGIEMADLTEIDELGRDRDAVHRYHPGP